MRQYRQFQFDQNYAPAEFKAFVNELHSKHQHYVRRTAKAPDGQC